MALTFANLVTAYDNVDRTVYTTASFSVTAGRPVVVFLENIHSPGAAPSATLSGLGTTWTEVVDYLPVASRREMAFLGIPPSGATGVLTITMVDEGAGTTAIGCAWSVIDCLDAATTGTIVQSVTNLHAGNANFAITLASAASANNRTLGFARQSNNGALTAGANFTVLGAVNGSAPNGAYHSQRSTSAFQTTCNWSGPVSAAWGGIALEISEVSAPTGTIAVTQADQTAAITGTVANPITGTIGVTQADQVAAYAGSLGISGTIASTQQDQTAAFTGTAMGADWDCGDWDPLDWATDCAPTGVLASTQDNQTAVFTGTVANPITGTIGVTQADQTAAFAGTTVSDGTLASIQQNQTGAFTGTVANPITGTIGVTQQNQTAVFTGTVAAPAVTGTIGVTQQDQIAAFVGQSVSTAVTGTIASTQANQTMTAAGVVAMAVTGTIAVTQQNQTATFVGAVANPADTLVVSVTCTIGGPTATCTISPEMAVVGSDVVITSNFENAAGNPADPASVTAVVEAPDGTQSTPTPMSITVGEWTTTIPTDQYGFWFFEITGQGDDVNIVCKGSFCVERSLVSV